MKTEASMLNVTNTSSHHVTIVTILSLSAVKDKFREE